MTEPVELHHRDTGTGRPLVFLHGWGMALDVWDRQVTDLSGEFRTVTVDLRGHGRSPKPATGYDYEDHVADVLALLDRLALTDVVLVGWSMGGGIAARVATRTSAVSQVVLVCAPPKYEYAEDFPDGRPEQACAEFLDAVRTQRELTMWETAVATFARPPIAPVAHWLYGLSLQAPTWAVAQCFEGVRRADVRPDLGALTPPPVLLHGVHDVFITIGCARWVADHVPGVQLIEFEESGHAPFLEEREKFTAALRDVGRR